MTTDPRIQPHRLSTDSSTPAKMRCGSQVVRADGQAIDPIALKAVEQLDDTMFAALGGDASALDAVGGRLRAVRRRVAASLIAEARDKYIERAEQTWNDYRRGDEADVVRAFAALDVLLMLELAND